MAMSFAKPLWSSLDVSGLACATEVPTRILDVTDRAGSCDSSHAAWFLWTGKISLGAGAQDIFWIITCGHGTFSACVLGWEGQNSWGGPVFCHAFPLGVPPGLRGLSVCVRISEPM